MLKRYQVLLNDWMVDHYQVIAKKYDVSFSEMIRMALCVDILTATRAAYPKHKTRLSDKRLKEAIKSKNIVEHMGVEKFHKFVSDIYFEARKATELWTKDAQGEERSSTLTL